MDYFIDIRRLLMAFLRRWWILVASAVLAGTIGYSISLTQTRVYAAITTVHVGRPISSNNLDRLDLQLGEQLALTYADLVRRRPVLQGAIGALKLDSSWRDLRSRVQVSPVENTQLLEIRVSAGSPAEAQMTADELARQLILRSPSSGQGKKGEENKQFVQQRLRKLQANIEAGQQRLAGLEAEMAKLIEVPVDRLTALQGEVRTLEALITEWDSTYALLLTSLETELSANQLTVVEAAEANPTPIRPRVRLNTLIAVLLGLLLATGLILLLEFLDNTFKPTDAVSEILGLVTLGGISRIKGKSIQEKLIFRQDVLSPASEDYRLLGNKIQMLCANWPRKIIMVTSPTPGELKSITVANLGVVLAQMGCRVIIIDANLRQPAQHAIFQLPSQRGLTQLLYAPMLELDGQLENTDVKNLQVLTVGALPPPHPSELLGSRRMGELLDHLAERADIVLCDSAHVVAIADALVLASQVDGVVLMVEIGKTRRSVAEHAVYNLQLAGANLLGAVLSPMPAAKVATTKLKTPVVSTMNGRYTNGREQKAEPRTIP